MAVDLEALRDSTIAAVTARMAAGMVETYPTINGPVHMTPWKDMQGWLTLLGGLVVPTATQSATTYAEVVT
jgi:hypothetical protein